MAQTEYEALARKYRPQTFADVVGQRHVIAALTNAISKNMLHHAYLLTGTRGIGKTTIARIIAKCLLCQTGLTASPCCRCDACVQIAQGSHPDVIEIDGASQTKVEDTRRILENTQYPPSVGRYKIYIIDEVHMLSQSSFNALLKTLEEPPGYVKFLLATTDPQKIPATVLSRCLQFSLKALSQKEIAQRLTQVCALEGIACEEQGISLLARAAHGSMRDSLSLCDQALALGSGEIKASLVKEMLGTAGDGVIGTVLELLRTDIAPGAQTQLGSALEQVHALAPNYKALLEEMADLFHDIAMFQFVGGTRLDVFSHPAQTLETYAVVFRPQDLQTYYQITLNGLEELRFAPSAQSVFDMTVLRLLAFTPEKKKIG